MLVKAWLKSSLLIRAELATLPDSGIDSSWDFPSAMDAYYTSREFRAGSK